MKSENVFGVRAFLLGSVMSLSGCVISSFRGFDEGELVTCSGQRNECQTSDGYGCHEWQDLDTPIRATVCKRDSGESGRDACRRVLCNNLLVRNCAVDEIQTTSAITDKLKGICVKDTASTHLASIQYKQHYYNCSNSQEVCGNLTGSALEPIELTQPSTPVPYCIDVTHETAMQIVSPGYVAPNATAGTLDPIALGSVEITAFKPDDPACSLVSPAPADQSFRKYSVPGGTLGEVKVATAAFALTATKGMVTVVTRCPSIPNPDPNTTYDPPKCALVLQSAQVSVADVTTPVATITGVVIRSVAEAPITSISGNVGQVAANSLLLAVSGNVNGTPTEMVVTNPAPWSITTGTAALNINGTIDLIASGVGGVALPVQASLNVTAPKATPAEEACSSGTPAQRTFGFEDSYRWTSSTAALSDVSTPKTQGCGALGVAGQGYITLVGDKFATTAITPQSALSVDLFVPGGQPNPWWIGAMQMHFSCPSGAVNNQYVGQVELTGLPTGAYSTLRFPLPAGVLTNLNRYLIDCFFSISLNVNPVAQSWKLDNLRFTP
jgi:hypothetical protein